jgi:hypothetical protein
MGSYAAADRLVAEYGTARGIPNFQQPDIIPVQPNCRITITLNSKTDAFVDSVGVIEARQA